jgi:hypothetical protein
MPLDARKIAHIAAVRDRIRAGRTETVTLVAVAGGVTTYTAVPNVTWYDAGAVPAGITTRSGDVTRVGHDAIAEFPSSTVFPTGLKLIARTATASQAGVAATTDRFTVLDKRPLGLGLPPNRWLLRLRRLK